MDSNVTTVYADVISAHDAKITAYAVTRVDSDGNPVNTFNVWDCEMPHVVNDCDNNGWELIVRH